MTAKSNKTAYNAGAKACAKGAGGEQNPHDTASADSKSWEHGYLDRQKVMSNTRRPPGVRAPRPTVGQQTHR